MSIIDRVIYIRGGFHNYTLKDILLLYIFYSEYTFDYSKFRFKGLFYLRNLGNVPKNFEYIFYNVKINFTP